MVALGGTRRATVSDSVAAIGVTRRPVARRLVQAQFAPHPFRPGQIEACPRAPRARQTAVGRPDAEASSRHRFSRTAMARICRGSRALEFTGIKFGSARHAMQLSSIATEPHRDGSCFATLAEVICIARCILTWL